MTITEERIAAMRDVMRAKIMVSDEAIEELCDLAIVGLALAEIPKPRRERMIAMTHVDADRLDSIGRGHPHITQRAEDHRKLAAALKLLDARDPR